jgi:hypothetical protein
LDCGAIDFDELRGFWLSSWDKLFFLGFGLACGLLLLWLCGSLGGILGWLFSSLGGFGRLLDGEVFELFFDFLFNRLCV